MKFALIIIGGILVLFGITDFISSYAGTDLWGEIIGIQLPEIIWKFSAYAEMLIGYLLFKAGMNASEDAAITE